MDGGLTLAMPVFNAMPYLPEAVESILAQTYDDFEFIIIDDGSTDDSSEYIRFLRDPRVTTFHQENQGLGATLNRSLDLCRTDFYARMDADDVSAPNRLATQVQVMRERPDLSALGTQVCFIAGERRLRSGSAPLDHAAIRRQLLCGVSGMCHASTMLRMEAARRVGGYRIRGAGQDFDFLLRMSEVGRLANCAGVLYEVRLHRASTALTNRVDIYCGMAYATLCARCRERDEPEPPYDHFKQRWAMRPWPVKLRDSVDDWSGLLYRHALIDLGYGRVVRGTARLAVAAACRPRAALRQIAGRASRMMQTAKSTHGDLRA